jgi:hypothetical protein
MQIAADAPRTHVRRRAALGDALIPAGVALMLVGVIGDLVGRTLATSTQQTAPLIVLSLHGNSPWHLMLFAGILVTAVGGIRWATKLESELGGLLSAGMVLLLGVTMVLGVWSGLRSASALPVAAAAVPRTVPVAPPGSKVGTVTFPAGHVHNAGSVDGSGDVLGEGGSHVHGVAVPLTAAERPLVAKQLAAAKAATSKYKDINVARADGYFQVTQFIPGLGLHLANLKISNTVFDPATPNVLLYEPTVRGGYKLVGVAYSIAQQGADPPVGFVGGSDVWHFHQNLCFLPGGQVTVAPSETACKSRQGYFQARTAWLLHAWIWQKNPAGVFTEYNPRVF